MSGRPRPIICLDCEQRGFHGGRGLCNACYSHHTRMGTLHKWPTVRGNTAWQNSHLLEPLPPPHPEEPEPAHHSGDTTWEARSACRGADGEIWFPISETGDNPQVKVARRICRGCPVREACLNYALTTRQAHGIWGGLTSPERRQLELRQAERATA
ncbi:WhiB family transcriptional regulator [Nonomuraea sp. SYSU D8015]|uniref:WhiB family transcriptional regulator n=1 Tax=Nonomuraea sp. SYSU D8015 TaxID=2593644 RepID=UPI001CB70554|nr:WhiB family transcriptional regulator [Nonomuraea sp. SYSU D8015]